MLSVVRIENVQGRVVLGQSLDGRCIVGANLCLIHVLHVVLDLHLHRISLTWDEEAVSYSGARSEVAKMLDHPFPIVIFAALEFLVPIFL